MTNNNSIKPNYNLTSNMFNNDEKSMEKIPTTDTNTTSSSTNDIPETPGANTIIPVENTQEIVAESLKPVQYPSFKYLEKIMKSKELTPFKFLYDIANSNPQAVTLKQLLVEYKEHNKLSKSKVNRGNPNVDFIKSFENNMLSEYGTIESISKSRRGLDFEDQIQYLVKFKPNDHTTVGLYIDITDKSDIKVYDTTKQYIIKRFSSDATK